MEIEGVVHNGVVVPDQALGLAEGTRVRIVPKEPSNEVPFSVRHAEFKGAISNLPEDLASQHDHYRLGTQKR